MAAQIPTSWITKWKRLRQEIWQDEGYDWAAGMLLRGGTTEETLSYIQTGSGADSFDQGVVEACREWILRNKGD